MYIQKKDIINKIKCIDTNKGAGPDNIFCKNRGLVTLFLLFNKYLYVGEFPCSWRVAKVVPVLPRPVIEKIFQIIGQFTYCQFF